jgi:hypothetical protein
MCEAAKVLSSRIVEPWRKEGRGSKLRWTDSKLPKGRKCVNSDVELHVPIPDSCASFTYHLL